jgi:hypothetical protein
VCSKKTGPAVHEITRGPEQWGVGGMAAVVDDLNVAVREVSWKDPASCPSLPACTHRRGAAAGETIYLAGDNLAFIVLLKDHFIRRSLISTEQKPRITGGRPNMGMRSTMETFDGRNRCFDISAQRSNECVRLIRKLRWIGMDDEAERVSAQLSGWRFRPTETVIAGPWATD